MRFLGGRLPGDRSSPFWNGVVGRKTVSPPGSFLPWSGASPLPYRETHKFGAACSSLNQDVRSKVSLRYTRDSTLRMGQPQLPDPSTHVGGPFLPPDRCESRALVEKRFSLCVSKLTLSLVFHTLSSHSLWDRPSLFRQKRGLERLS